MKNFIIFLISINLIIITIAFSMKPLVVKADVEGCKWKQYICPGWWGDTYEACLTIGDGNSCTCGQVTRDCDKTAID